MYLHMYVYGNYVHTTIFYLSDQLSERSKVRTNGHFHSIKARFEHMATATGHHDNDTSERAPPDLMPRKTHAMTSRHHSPRLAVPGTGPLNIRKSRFG